MKKSIGIRFFTNIINNYIIPGNLKGLFYALLVMAMVYIGHRDFLNVVCSIAVATVVVWIDGNMRY